jgi:hypothetical protein
MKSGQSMREFRSYLDYLDSLVTQIAGSSDYSSYAEIVDDALDGQPARELRKLVSLEDLRAAGAFFTGSNLSQIALRRLVKTLDDDSILLDPACGTGDLLIACAPWLPRGENLASTLQRWSKQIVGYDLHPEFIHAAKIRLILTAIHEGILIDTHRAPQVRDIFPNIERRSILEEPDVLKIATHIVLNPPYTLVDTPEGCTWTSGKANAAAFFMAACVQHAQAGTRLVAILPDVLRSGSRYQKWRELIESRSRLHRIELYGQFDRWADVDVFILELEIQQSPKVEAIEWNQVVMPPMKCISDRFDVCVGPVVDYRDPHRGPWYPFIKSRDLPAWRTLRNISHHRRFKGRVFSPPFVVVRRTSRQGDRCRAIGTIIDNARPVAVENHLLVLIPRDGSIETCQQLLQVLKKPETTQWLDQRIRCRHLTVSSLEEIPWWTAENE